MSKELKELQTDNLLKPRVYGFGEVKALLKEQKRDIDEEWQAKIKKIEFKYETLVHAKA